MVSFPHFSFKTYSLTSVLIACLHAANPRFQQTMLPLPSQMPLPPTSKLLHLEDERRRIPRKTDERLPSVSQLLTNSPSPPPPPPPPPQAQAFGMTPFQEYPWHHLPDHDGLSRHMTRAFGFTNTAQPSRESPHQTSLPPISQVAPHAPHHHDGDGETWLFRNSATTPLHDRHHLNNTAAAHFQQQFAEDDVSSSSSSRIMTPPRHHQQQQGKRPQTPPIRPQVVDERYVEGQGMCYIYEDGSYCPKTINGVPVNARWGITKAGKPRKRLAQACMTCREKKIKCHPNLPRCDQCQKSGRECRFENA